ncbi:MAG TPA: hypothetical protein VF105_14200 [Gemmatimonadaceae bacterium]
MKLSTITQRVRHSGVMASSAFALIAGLAVASTACAQGQGQNAPPQGQETREGRGQRDPQQRIDHRISELTQSLQLSADQQSRIRTILNNERTQMDALRQKNGLQGPQGRVERPDGQRPDSDQRGDRGGRGRGFGGRNMPPEVKALHDQTEKQIEGVLNSTQLAKYRELRQQREQERQKREGGQAGQRA